MVLNLQSQIPVRVGAVRSFVRRLRLALRLGKRDFNVCFVGDREIRKLNQAYRREPRPTDVLSFPWRPQAERGAGKHAGKREFADFLGDVVISVETARRNARAEGHSLQNEIRWLILHGVLHLLGYDHVTDNGEMTALELSLRARLGIDGVLKTRRRKPEARGKSAER